MVEEGGRVSGRGGGEGGGGARGAWLGRMAVQERSEGVEGGGGEIGEGAEG